jgi:hypothetical protein
MEEDTILRVKILVANMHEVLDGISESIEADLDTDEMKRVIGLAGTVASLSDAYDAVVEVDDDLDATLEEEGH